MSTKTLPLPAGDQAEIHVVDGHTYMVVRIDGSPKVDWYLSELKAKRSVMVPQSKRGHLVGALKKAGIHTTSKTVVPGQWALFTPCKRREFRS